MSNLLEIKNLNKVFVSRKSKTKAVNNVSLSLPGDKPITLAVVGESGSGKSTLANLVLDFIRPTSGQILYQGKDLSALKGKEHNAYRREVQAIFQNPFDAYNPFYTVDHAFKQVFDHFDFSLSKEEQRALVEENLRLVKLDPSQVLGKYSYQMSGGQLQRILVARALLLKPKLLIADEPVSMIDASLRVTVLDVMVRLKKELGISQLYITHDLSTALQISDEIIVMYKGCVVESGKAEDVILHPVHPYTQLLIQSIPIASPEEKWQDAPAAEENKNPQAGQEACCFSHRCPYYNSQCAKGQPELIPWKGDHKVSCYRYQNSPGKENGS
ncbi:ABC transporter ATP-binding protein [Angelakisella massiliensis]|uniref:ABC transporter ATP-binding protein n=1 Tax=Angelakisella massiliensis TaxID=1871018 RepID=UPI0008F91D30|nr:ABC transporter ATP-binding protein [Angelakisella massiliensis]